MFTSVDTSHSLIRDMMDDSRKEEAWRAFCELYREPIRRWCLRLCRRHGVRADLADSVVQSVLTRLYLKLGSYDPRRRFRPWLQAVVRSVYFDHLREQKKTDRQGSVGGSDHQDLLAQLRDPHPWERLVDALESSLDPCRRQALLRVRGSVEVQTWRAFYLLTVQDKSGAEVAARLGMSIGAVHQAKYRVRQLAQQEYDRLVHAAGQPSSR